MFHSVERKIVWDLQYSFLPILGNICSVLFLINSTDPPEAMNFWMGAKFSTVFDSFGFSSPITIKTASFCHIPDVKFDILPLIITSLLDRTNRVHWLYLYFLLLDTTCWFHKLTYLENYKIWAYIEKYKCVIHFLSLYMLLIQ